MGGERNRGRWQKGYLYAVVCCVKHGFNLVVPRFCSAPEAREPRGALLWFLAHQPNLEMPPNLLSPYTSEANSKPRSAVQLCPEKVQFPHPADTQLDGLGGMNPPRGRT